MEETPGCWTALSIDCLTFSEVKRSSPSRGGPHRYINCDPIFNIFGAFELWFQQIFLLHKGKKNSSHFGSPKVAILDDPEKWPFLIPIQCLFILKRLIHQNSGGSRYEKGRKITLNLRLQKLQFGIIQNVRFLCSRIWYFWVALGATRNLPEFTTPNVSKNTRIGLKKVGIMYVCGPPLLFFNSCRKKW